MTLYQAIERPLLASHGKEGVSGSSPLLGFIKPSSAQSKSAVTGA
jgi:hypothetical protein